MIRESESAPRDIWDFQAYKAEDKEKLERSAEELRFNINRILPCYLEDPTANVLSDRRLKERLDTQWKEYRPAWNLDFDSSRRDKRHRSLTAFHRSLLDALIPQLCNPVNGPTSATAASSLTKLAFGEACRHLEDSIVSERAAASFVCGGSISAVASPVRLFWARKGDTTEAYRLVLPLNATAMKDSSHQALQQLVDDCEAASFGRGQQDVMDLEYRRAGKLDPSQFV